MTLGVGDRLAKVDENGKPIENEMAREFEVIWISGYTKVVLVVLEEKK